MLLYDAYLGFLILTKLVFVYFVVKNRIEPSDLAKTRIVQADNVFKVGTAILMIYLFRPRNQLPLKIDNHTKLCLFTFGILTVFDFFKEERKEKKEREKE